MFPVFQNSLIAISTFLIGVSAFIIVSSLAVPAPVNVIDDEAMSVETVDACDLDETSGKFIGKRIVTTATIYSIENHTVVFPIHGCFNNGDSIVFTDRDLENYFGQNQDLKYILKDKKPFSEVDVQIEGIVKRLPNQDELFYYIIEPTNLKIVSPLRKFTPKGAA